MSQRPAPQLFTVTIVTDEGTLYPLPGHWELDDCIEALASYAEKGLVICNVHPDVNQGLVWIPPTRIKRGLVIPVPAKEGE